MRTKYFIGFLFLLFLVGCFDLKDMEHVPTTKRIKLHFSEFLAKPSNIQGIYGNHDLNATLFMYKTEDQKIFNTIEERAKEAKWILRNKTSAELEFYKIYEKGVGIYGLIRIGYRAEGHRVCVASFIHTNEKWAIKKFWPKYENCKKGENIELNSKNNS